MSSQATGKKKIGLNSVISWGASVVIIGLMFKILHWKGAEFMIAAGLITEAILFAILGFAAMNAEEETDAPAADQKSSGLNELLAKTISPEVITKLGQGFDQFNKTVASVNGIIPTAAVAQTMFKEIEAATADVKKFRDQMNAIAGSFDAFGKTMAAMGQLSAASQGMLKDFEVAGKGMQAYAKNMGDMNASFDTFNKTLTAINQMTTSSQNMLKEFEAATQGMKAYNKNISDLAKV